MLVEVAPISSTTSGGSRECVSFVRIPCARLRGLSDERGEGQTSGYQTMVEMLGDRESGKKVREMIQ